MNRVGICRMNDLPALHSQGQLVIREEWSIYSFFLPSADLRNINLNFTHNTTDSFSERKGVKREYY